MFSLYFFSPKCRTEYSPSLAPSVYKCFCGKTVDPDDDPWLIPHSCGDTCGKSLKPSCGHKCLLLCHPGHYYHHLLHLDLLQGFVTNHLCLTLQAHVHHAPNLSLYRVIVASSPLQRGDVRTVTGHVRKYVTGLWSVNSISVLISATQV